MNLFALTSLIMGVVSLVLAIFILYHAKTISHRFWAYFNLSLGVYGVALFLAGTNKTYSEAFFYWKIALFGVANISMFFYLFISELTRSSNKLIYKLVVAHGITFGFLALTTDLVVNSLKFLFDQFYFISAGLTWNILFSIWIIIVIYSFVELHKFIKTQKGLRRTQANYLFYSMLLGFTSGASTGIVAWAAILYPAWHVLICVYAAIATYAIFRYQLLDIKIALTRVVVFIPVYAIVLGIPFGLAISGRPWLINILGENWFWAPMLTLLVLATVGPYVYMFLHRRAEDKLLAESRAVQDLLTNFSIGLRSVRELTKLNKMIVRELGKSLQLDFAGIYLLDPNSGEYLLKMSEPVLSQTQKVKSDHPLLTFLRNKNGPLMLDELKHQLENEKENSPVEIKLTMELFQNLRGVLIIPAIKENIILAFIVLGEPKVKIAYSREFLGVLAVVGNQIALAIENALFYEETGKDWIQRAHDSRQKTMGAMGTGVAHQIRNRFNAISTQALFLQDLFAGFDSKNATPQDFEKLKEEYNRVTGRIFGDIEQGAEICENIKNYAKNTEGKPQLVDLEQTITGAMRLLNLARKNINFTLSKQNTQGVMLWTNLSMLQDMFLNMFDNSDDAIVSKKEAIARGEIEKEADGFKVNISANPNGKMCEIVVFDNGKGIRPEHLEEDKGVNVMWFTTKGAQKGTGMGIHFMREFVKHSGGTLKIESEYTKGTKISFTLPLATEEQKKQGEMAA